MRIEACASNRLKKERERKKEKNPRFCGKKEAEEECVEGSYYVHRVGRGRGKHWKAGFVGRGWE